MSNRPDRKPIENRAWRATYRGRLWIHAPRAIDRDAAGRTWESAGLKPGHPVPVGVMLGYVTLAHIFDPGTYDSPWAQEGCYHWLLLDPVLLATPYPCAGALGFWWAPPEVSMLPLLNGETP